MTLDRRIAEFTGAESDAPLDTLPLSPAEAQTEPEEPIQVAGAAGVIRKGVGAVKDFLEPLYRPGAKMAPRDEVKIVKPPDPPPVAPIAPVAPPPVVVKPARPAIKAAPLDETQKLVREREALIAADDVGGKPPAQAFNTDIYDEVGLKATIKAAAQQSDIDYERMSLRAIYKEALDQGVPEKVLDRMLAGEKLSTTVGDSDLAKSVAEAVIAFRESGKRLDEMMAKASTGEISDAEEMALRQAITVHDTLSRSMKGYQVDVARSLNVFKDVGDLDTSRMRAALDELGGRDTLIQLAQDYTRSGTRANKNRLLEKGVGAKMREAWFYTFQSNLLNDVGTYARNLGGNAAFGVLQPVERVIATAIGRGRTLLPGTNPDRYTLEDNYAVSHGFVNALMDGWDLMAKSVREGGAVGLKADQVAKQNPLTADYWSDTPLTLFGKEMGRTPDLKDTPAAKVIDGLAFVQSIPFRVLSSTDEFFGGIAARWQLHSEAWTFANKEFDRLIASGVDEKKAMSEVNKQVEQLLVERPADMQASIENFRKMVTFQTDLASYRDVPTGEAYWKISQALENPFMKILVPFNKTLLNIWIEGTARVPGLNLISPRFYQDWQAGGRQRDLAVARVAMGGSSLATASYLALNNRITGYGPSQQEDRMALEALGWLPYSIAFDKGELSQRNIEKLSGITKVSVGEDKVYVSYSGFEPISTPFAMGADLADAMKFARGGEWDEDVQSIFKVGAFSAGNYMSSMPLLQGIGDLIRIGRSRSEDTGEKVVQILDGIAKQAGNFVVTGAPGVGLANSSLTAHIERLMNPTRSNTMPDAPDIPYGERAFYETYQRLRSRIPGLSDSVPPALDSLGRPLESVTYRDHWVNWNPAVSARTGKRSAIDELLVELDFGIHEPPKSMDGVPLSATMFNRFKQLYGQEIKLDGMNLEAYIPEMLKAAEADALESGMPLQKGDKQKLIMSAVQKFRSLAKMRMVGDPEGSPIPGDEIGLAGDITEFPELRALITRERDKGQAYGR